MSMRRSGHDLSGLVDTAMRLLDELGLPDLSMRRLAGALGVQPSALYWHVADKQTLLAAVADRIVAEAAATDPAPRGAEERSVIDTATALRAALLAHRDGAEVVLSSAALALDSGAAQEMLRAAFTAGGAQDAERAAAITWQFTLGHASLVQQRMQAAQLGAYSDSPDEIDRTTLADFVAGIAALSRAF